MSSLSAREEPVRATPSRVDSLLDVRDLVVSLPTDAGLVEAVRGVSFTLHAGETIGVVGESGSGKSLTSLAIMGLLPRSARVSGSILLNGTELLDCNPREWRDVRGSRVAMIFQDPMTALNPMHSVGWQVAECIVLHHHVSRRVARRRAVELLDLVGLPQPDQTARRFPHELSGGMRQRVVIAIAIANEPDLLIADEPTTGLDVTVQAQILDTLHRIRHETKSAMILITHDLGVVAGVADRVLVMYAGKTVEIGPVDDIFARPRMPYTMGLLASLPALDTRFGRLTSIPGAPPTGIDYSPGCAFASRCPIAEDRCRSDQPALLQVGTSHVAACHFAGELEEAPLRQLSWDDGAIPGVTHEAPLDRAGADVVISVRGLTKHFRVRGATFRSVAELQAVNGVDLDLRSGRCLALVGESGCGKSTLARLLMRLEEPTSGQILLNGVDITRLDDKEMRPKRQQIQMVFQDPYSSLNPHLSVGEIVGEPLIVHKVPDRETLVSSLLASVGIDPSARVRFATEFSGGQRQRIGIARALALSPDTMVLDEPVSALDVSIQSSILNLLRDLQQRRNMSYLLIAHDLAVVRQVADDVAVMYLGTIVEKGPVDLLYDRPAHPYTNALLSAVPVPDPTRERGRTRILLTGEIPSPVNPPSGCRFRTRCWKADGRCATDVPTLRELGGGHEVACHYPENGPWEELADSPSP